MSLYNKIYIVGTGAVANSCALCVKKAGEETVLIESRPAVVPTCQQFCEKHDIKYLQLSGDDLTLFLLSIDDPALIVSAANRYLFPQDVISKNNLTIINYHGALLPKHPGRNAEAWAIYDGDIEAGITWHTVVADVDAGNILIQKSVHVTDKTTSFTLLRINSKLVVEGFEEILPGILGGTIEGVKQTGKQPLHYSWQKPNDGIFDLKWSGKQMSAFLRAMDYGPLKTMGYPSIVVDGNTYAVLSYKQETNGLQSSDDAVELRQENEGNSVLTIQVNEYRFELQLEKVNFKNQSKK